MISVIGQRREQPLHPSGRFYLGRKNIARLNWLAVIAGVEIIPRADDRALKGNAGKESTSSSRRAMRKLIFFRADFTSLFIGRWFGRRDEIFVLFHALDDILAARRFLPAWNDLRTEPAAGALFRLPEKLLDLQMIDDFLQAHHIGQGLEQNLMFRRARQ